MSPLIKANQFRLSQLDRLLSLLTDREYVQPMPLLGGSSIGQHCRHIVENYYLLFNRAEAVVNYDLRARKTERETDRELMRSIIGDIMARVNALREDIPLLWEGRLVPGSPESTTAATSLFRELAYNVEHCINYMAILRIAWSAIRPDQPMDESFGVAASTVNHRNAVSF